jgi:6-phospho-beta-glucosidase
MTRATGKVAIIGGGGIRTPLVVFGINEAAGALGVHEVVLYDPDRERMRMMVALGRAVVHRDEGALIVRQASSFEDAVNGAEFVLNSVRVGGIAARTADERTAIRHGYPGQETTGPGGMAMALRTIPVAVEQARQVHKLAPQAWLINFTNPAGLITQAITQHTDARVVGICDTPTEMLHRIATALTAQPNEVHCEYLGLNHLGWIRKILLRGEDVTDRIFADDHLLSQLYSAPLFDYSLIRSLRLIPTEYLFFYYSRSRALANQLAYGSTRGEEIERLNTAFFDRLQYLLDGGDDKAALSAYENYLNIRSGSYMALEASGSGTLNRDTEFKEDPFRAVTGYHRIALDVMQALRGTESRRVIVNTRNQGAIDCIDANDVVEIPCRIGGNVIVPERCGALPAEVRGLVMAVKEYERATIEAAMTGSNLMARKAMLLYPAIGEWEPSEGLLRDLMDPVPSNRVQASDL